MGFKLLVCGGRDFSDRDRLFATLDRVHAKRPIVQLISGGADGADTLARKWAKARQIPHLEFRADWNRYGLAAGPIRNQQMLDEGQPDGVVAFPGERGTADMIQRAREAEIQVMEITR